MLRWQQIMRPFLTWASPSSIAIEQVASPPVSLRSFPGLGIYFRTDTLSLVECQYRELSVTVVAARTGIRPGAGPVTFPNLVFLQPTHVGLNGERVLLRSRGTEHHGLECHGIGFLGLRGTKEFECFADCRVIGRNS